MSEHRAPTVARSFAFKLVESVGTQAISFAVYIVMARLLSPSDYGVLTILAVFIAVSQVFVQSGLNTALIQKKEIDDADCSSVFWVSLGVAGALYALLYLCAPAVGAFYDMPMLTKLLRVLALVLLPGALISVEQAVAARAMRFQRLMVSALIATALSGAVGVGMAMGGLGVWALVGQQLTSQFGLALALWVAVGWRPRAVVDQGRLGSLLSFGWKLLVSSLIDTVYGKLRDLVIGKKYDSGTLGVFNRGKQFPELVMNAVNGSIQSVMLPVLSREQDDRAALKSKMRRSIMASSYLVFPMMAGLIVVARPLVSALLTDKWLACVPFLQICCVDFAFYPIHTANLQAINAMGRSDLFLRLELVKKVYGVAILLVTVFCFHSAIAIAAGGAVSTLLSAFVNALPNRRLLGYGYREQMRDVLPPLSLSLLMALVAAPVGLLGLGAFATLGLQILAGMAAYAALSLVFKPEGYRLLRGALRDLLRKRRAEGGDAHGLS